MVLDDLHTLDLSDLCSSIVLILDLMSLFSENYPLGYPTVSLK